MTRTPALALILALVACGGGDADDNTSEDGTSEDTATPEDTGSDTDTGSGTEGDVDGDGFTEAQGDCDDSDPDVYPRPFTTRYEVLRDSDDDGTFETPTDLREYAYDEVGRKVRDYFRIATGERETTFAFNSAGQPTEEIRHDIASSGPTGLTTTTWTYDAEGRHQTYLLVRDRDDEAETDARMEGSWTYNPATMASAYEETHTQVTGTEEPTLTGTVTGTYVYDSEARLVSSIRDSFTSEGVRSQSEEQTFAFDPSGNRTLWHTVTYRFRASGDTESVRNFSYAYDSAGRVTEETIEVKNGSLGGELSGYVETKTTTYDTEGQVLTFERFQAFTNGQQSEGTDTYEGGLLQTSVSTYTGSSNPLSNYTETWTHTHDSNDRRTRIAGERDRELDGSIDERQETTWTYNDQDLTGERVDRSDSDNDGTWDSETLTRIEFDELGNATASESGTYRREAEITMICL